MGHATHLPSLLALSFSGVSGPCLSGPSSARAMNRQVMDLSRSRGLTLLSAVQEARARRGGVDVNSQQVPEFLTGTCLPQCPLHEYLCDWP